MHSVTDRQRDGQTDDMMMPIADYIMQQYNRLKVLGCLLVLAVLMSEGSEFKACGAAKENDLSLRRRRVPDESSS